MTRRGARPRHPVDTHGDPLTFAVAGLLAEPPGTVREYRIEDADMEPGEGLRLTSPVAGRVRLSRTNRGLVVDAILETRLAGECARCLRPVATPLTLRIDEEVLPSIDLASGQPVAPEPDGDPEATRLTGHHELELRPLVAEAIAMVEPIAPLCEPDCPGLCSVCGRRRAPHHAHDDSELDPRLAVLRSFRVDGPAETE